MKTIILIAIDRSFKNVQMKNLLALFSLVGCGAIKENGKNIIYVKKSQYWGTHQHWRWKCLVTKSKTHIKFNPKKDTIVFYE